MADVTFVFENGTTYAIHQGKVIAASTDSDEVERQVKQALVPPDSRGGDLGALGPPMPHPDAAMGAGAGAPGLGQVCPECGGPDDGSSPVCPTCGAPLQQDLGHPGLEHGGLGPHEMPSPGLEMGGEAGPYMAKVTTPNGLRGTVLGKVAQYWGDEVTVRLENGRIVKLPVGLAESHTEKTAATQPSPIQRLEARLASTPDGTRESLVVRSQELARIRAYASNLIREGVSYADSLRLDQLVITAEVEQAEITDAIAHLDDVDSIAAPGFSIGAADNTPGVSREDASWLDHTLDGMIAEAQATDFTKLMDEGPEAFTAELPDVALADTGVTRSMASSFIAEKTAAIERQIAEPYVTTFLARVEQCRREALSTRKQVVHKEAAAQEDTYKDVPDDCLFM